MTEYDVNARAAHGEARLPATAGALLADARVAAGLSIDAVAQQLKLAPRQVRALEEGDFTHLPGRTFVRGFVRNYARLVRLDPDRVLGALAAGPTASELAAPTLQPTAPTIGELPTSDRAKAGWTRWAIPLTLAAIVAATAVYEWYRAADDARQLGGTSAPDAAVEAAPSSGAPEGSVVPLANPLDADAPASGAAPVPAAAAPGAAPVPVPAARPAPARPTGAAPSGDRSLSFSFRDYSWTEVRDRDGRVLLSGMNPGGTEQKLSGTPPFNVVVGNATDVSVRYQGQPVDLAPHTRQGVARFTLP